MIQVAAAMALVGQAALLGIGMLWLGGFVCEPARKALLWVRQAFQGIEVWSAFLVALLATSGSLFFSEYSGFIPCHLCWLQRYCMYPLVLILPAAALWPKQWLLKAALIVPVAGLGISVWHRYVEANPAAGSQGCRKGGGCAVNWLEGLAPFDFITIPTLSMTAFALIIVFLLAAIFSPSRSSFPQVSR
jgi:disulfide bond formation protein DsbB